MNVDKFIEKIRNCEFLPENDMRRVILAARRIFIEEPNVIRVQAPVTVCGDVHGQFHDLLKLFRTGGEIPDTSYLFMGDYVDRGFNSLETFAYFLLLKIKYPDRIVLLRGNHETRNITQIYGFHDECVRKYGQGNIWRMCCDIFDTLPVGAMINNKIFCIHAGLSPEIRTVDQICKLYRLKEIPSFGPLADLMWSDPDSSLLTWQVNSRGAGYCFGERVVDEFSQVNGLDLIARAHQMAEKGFKYHFKKKNLVTVWSAPNYYYRCGNLACVFPFDENLEATPKVFDEEKEAHEETKLKLKQKPMYFLNCTRYTVEKSFPYFQWEGQERKQKVLDADRFIIFSRFDSRKNTRLPSTSMEDKIPESASSSWREGIQYKGLKNEIDLQHEFLLYNKVPNITSFVENDKIPIVVYGSKEKRLLHFLTVKELRNGSLSFSQLPEIELDYPINSMDWANEKLLVGSSDRKVHLLNINNVSKIRKEEVGTFYHEKNEKNLLDYLPLTDQYTFSNVVHSVQTNPQFKNFFLTLMNNKLYLWDFTRGEEPRQTIKGSNLPVLCGEWNPHTGNEIMISGRSRNLKLLDFRTLRGRSSTRNLVIWARENAHQEAIRAVQWNPFHPHWIASCGNDGAVNLWDLRYSTDPLVTLKGHENIVKSISWSHSHAEFIASGGIDKRISLFSTRFAPHYKLASVEKFEDVIVQVIFSRHSRNHLYGISSSGEFVACTLNSRFLKPLYVSKREDQKEKIVEQLVYCREFKDAFRQLKTIVKQKVKQGKFDESLDLISLFHPKQPYSSDRDPNVKFRKEIDLWSYHIPKGYNLEGKTLKSLEMLKFQSEILKYLKEGKFSKIRKYEDRLTQDIHLFEKNSLLGIVRIYLDQDYQLGIQFVMKIMDLLLKMRTNIRERRSSGKRFERGAEDDDMSNISVDDMERQLRKKIYAILDLVFMPSIFQRPYEEIRLISGIGNNKKKKNVDVVDDDNNNNNNNNNENNNVDENDVNGNDNSEEYEEEMRELVREEKEILHGMYRKYDYDVIMDLLQIQEDVMKSLVSRRKNAEIIKQVIQKSRVDDQIGMNVVASGAVWLCYLNSLLFMDEIPEFFDALNILLTKKVIRREDDDLFRDEDIDDVDDDDSGEKPEKKVTNVGRRRRRVQNRVRSFKRELYELVKIALVRLNANYEFFEFDDDEEAPLEYLGNKGHMKGIQAMLGVVLRLTIIPFGSSVLLGPLKVYLEAVVSMFKKVLRDFDERSSNDAKEKVYDALRPIIDVFDECEENGVSNRLTYLCETLKANLTDKIESLRISV